MAVIGASPGATTVAPGLRPLSVSASAATQRIVPVGEDASRGSQPDPAQSAETLREELNRAAEALSQHYAAQQSDLRFRVDEDSGRLVVTVLDHRDGSVIRQIPGEDALRLARSLNQSPGQRELRLIQQTA